jgi:hypothetical protein
VHVKSKQVLNWSGGRDCLPRSPVFTFGSDPAQRSFGPSTLRKRPCTRRRLGESFERLKSTSRLLPTPRCLLHSKKILDTRYGVFIDLRE